MVTLNRDIQYEIEQFLYREARLLDQGRFQEWLELFTDDLRYWMPVRETLQQQPDGLHQSELAVSHIDDDKQFLAMRVARLDTGLAHAETPPSRTRHLVTNVEIEDVGADEIDVYSNVLVFQSRREKSDYFFLGRREDRMRQLGGQWKIARRKIILDHTVLPRGLSVFF